MTALVPSASDDFFTAVFAQLPVMAILRGHSPDDTVQACRRAWELGIEVVEVTIESRRGEDALARAAAAAREQGRTIGAGTVTTVERVATAAAAGAAFTVAPGMALDVVQASLAAGMPHLPGVATATEVEQAGRTGLGWFKAFPAEQLTAGWLTAMHGPFPTARFVATGGVTAANGPDFLRAGAAAVAMGSAVTALTSADLGRLVGGTRYDARREA